MAMSSCYSTKTRISDVIVFRKAANSQQMSLFDEPVNVKPSVRDGKAVAGYTRLQKVGSVATTAKHPIHTEAKETPVEVKPPLPVTPAAVAAVLVRAGVTTPAKMAEVYESLKDKPLAVAYGAGVDSTAMIFALHAVGLKPEVITFADTGGEKPETYAMVHKMNALLAQWGWPAIQTVVHRTLAKTGYTTLEGNNDKNATLPSLAFGKKSCSIKWKQVPQDQLLLGVKSGPNKCDPHPFYARTKAAGLKITKLIGYDSGKADIRRSANLKSGDANFNYSYPLQTLGWTRAECVAAITAVAGPDMVPIKSACFFCPASKKWELFWLAAHHPELLERSLQMERKAMLGKHSRYNKVEFGEEWDKFIETKGSFPSTSTTVGLGRQFAWNQWARVNNVVDKDWKVLRTPEAQQRFLKLGEAPTEGDNALDQRTVGKNSLGIPLRKAILLFKSDCHRCDHSWTI
jgi:hypothetical protein